MRFASSYDLSSRVTGQFPSVEFVRFDQGEGATPATQDLLASADAVYAGQSFFSRETLVGLRRARWVQVPSAGFENLHLSTARQQGIIVTNGRGVYSIPIAEDVVCKMLSLVRHYPSALAKQRQSLWGGVPSARELHGSAVGLVGTGSIAGEVASRVKAFGMRVLGYNTTGRPVRGFDEVVSGSHGLERLLRESDFVIVTVPLSESTRGLVDGPRLRLMKPTAHIINIARGAVVDEPELVAALSEGRIAGAGLDVFEREPLPKDSPLWAMPNVIITPHNSGTGDGVLARLEGLLIANIGAFPDVERMVNVL